MTERIYRMAELSKQTDIYPEIVVPEYDRSYMLEPALICEALKTAQYYLAQPVKITPDDRFVGLIKFHSSIKGDIFRRSGIYYNALNERFYKQPFEKLYIRDHSHATADFRYIVEHGFEGLRERIKLSRTAHCDEPKKLEYLKSIEIVLNGMMAWEEKCADECERAAENESDSERAAELRKMGEILHRVPRYPAKTFREAVQSIYFAFQFLPDSLGTADRYFLAPYRKSITDGTVTRDEAKEYLQELYVMINGSTPPTNKWSSDKGAESHFCIGGFDENGDDCYSEISELMLESLMEVPLFRPQISLRWTEKTPREVLHRVMDCERHDQYKRVAFVSDTRRVKALVEKLGYDYSDAVSYTMVGCNEPATQGSINYGNGPFNAVRCLDRLLYEDTAEVLAAKSFDEFYALYEREFFIDAARYVEISNAVNRYYSGDVDIISSIIMDGPIEKAKSITDGGARISFYGWSMIGTVTVIDSLIVIRQFVYDDKIFTMDKLITMLRANWEGYEDERRLIYRKADYHGNDTIRGNETARRYTETVNKGFKDKRDQNGFKFLMGDLIGYCIHNVWFGSLMRATPDGRYNWDAISFGAGQSGGRDRNGISALLNSIAQMDPTNIMTGSTVTNLMLDEALIRDDDKFEKTVDLIEAYFKKGGIHIQFNYVSREELLDAQRAPEKHENMRVRVSGFSGYFTLLTPQLQNDIINRTQKDR